MGSKFTGVQKCDKYAFNCAALLKPRNIRLFPIHSFCLRSSSLKEGAIRRGNAEVVAEPAEAPKLQNPESPAAPLREAGSSRSPGQGSGPAEVK